MTRTRPQIDRFIGLVSPCPTSGCWHWMGGTTQFGHGRFRVGRKNEGQIGPHVFSFGYFKGPVPAGFFVLHDCDNPGCVNPSHLRLGTQADNAADAVKRGRMKALFKPGPNPARGTGKVRKLTPEMVISIRSDDRPSKVIARELNLHPTTIQKARNGKNWKSLQPLASSQAGLNEPATDS